MQVLVDSSVWIDYFRGGGHSDRLDYLIDENILTVNDLILAELIPSIKIKRQRTLIGLLRAVSRLSLNVIWEQIIDYQYNCMKKGINGIGIPDLMIAQNAIQHNCAIYTLDSHFKMMQPAVNVRLAFVDVDKAHKG
ncbi:MAG: PIN domain-containing protein [Myxococcota bacterium]|nr:PIN domain-containing protein [Myxococcota bacterium]